MRPITDLLGQPVLHGGERLRDQFLLPTADLAQMVGNQMNGRIFERMVFQTGVDPLGERVRFQRHCFDFGQGTVIEVRGVPGAFGLPPGGDLDELKPPRDGAPIAVTVSSGVLDRVLQIEQCADGVARVAFVHEH